jgi:hypothetical protein
MILPTVRRLLPCALLLAATAGCRHWYYVNPSVDARQFGQDQHECGTESAESGYVASFSNTGGYVAPRTGVNQDLFRACMRAKGYSTVKLPAADSPPAGHYYSDLDH